MLARRVGPLLSCIACLPVVASVVLTASAPEAPSGPPPDQAHVVMQDGKLVMHRTVWKPVHETRTREVTRPNGQRATEAYTVKVMVAEEQLQTVASDDYRVYSVAGQAIGASEAAERFVKETAVLVSRSGKMLDQA